MTPQEVIKNLSGMKQMECFTCMHPQEVGWCENNCHIDEIYDTAIEALEKQIPKKPKKLTYKPLIVGGWTYECPRCGCAVGENKFTDYEYIESMEPFCGQCGQAISWEGVIQNE